MSEFTRLGLALLGLALLGVLVSTGVHFLGVFFWKLVL